MTNLKISIVTNGGSYTTHSENYVQFQNLLLKQPSSPKGSIVAINSVTVNDLYIFHGYQGILLIQGISYTMKLTLSTILSPSKAYFCFFGNVGA